MNAIEIEQAVYALAEQTLDADEFPVAFLEAFGNEATTKRLRSYASNKSDQGDVLQANSIHLKFCGTREIKATFALLKASPVDMYGLSGVFL